MSAEFSDGCPYMPYRGPSNEKERKDEANGDSQNDVNFTEAVPCTWKSNSRS